MHACLRGEKNVYAPPQAGTSTRSSIRARLGGGVKGPAPRARAFLESVNKGLKGWRGYRVPVTSLQALLASSSVSLVLHRGSIAPSIRTTPD